MAVGKSGAAPRPLALWLCLWYAVLASGLSGPLADLARGGAAADEDFPCAHHLHCGCKNARECRAHCCCFPHWRQRLQAERAREAHSPLPGSRMRPGHCDGDAAALAEDGSLAPHLSPRAAAAVLPTMPRLPASDPVPAGESLRPEPPEKIPIGAALA